MVVLPDCDTKQRPLTRFVSGTPFADLTVSMRETQEHIGGYDIGVFLLAVTAAWLLIFYSGLFSH